MPGSRAAPETLRRHWAFPPFPASESFVLVLSSPSRKGTLLTKGFPVSSRWPEAKFSHPILTRLGPFKILQGRGSASWVEEEIRQPGCRIHCRLPALFFAHPWASTHCTAKGAGSFPSDSSGTRFPTMSKRILNLAAPARGEAKVTKTQGWDARRMRSQAAAFKSSPRGSSR